MATETFTRLYVLNYNNYGNRIIKKLSTVNEYKLADPSYKAYSDINFYRGDGVNTTQTVNFAVGTAEKDGDYMLVVKVTKVDGVETTETIVSRWFIIECKYNRRNQLIFTLRRDLIVDFWDYIYTTSISNNFFCEKGNVPATDNFIFNPEQMTFNQVLNRQDELALSGTGLNGYIVGYLDKSADNMQIPIAPEGVVVVDTRDDIPVYNAYINSTMIYGSPQFQYDFVAVDGKSKVDNTGGSTVYMYYVHVNNSQPVIGDPNPDTQLGAGYGSSVGKYNMESLHQNQAIYNMLTSEGASNISDALTMHLKTNMNFSLYSDYSYANNTVYYIKSENAFKKVSVSYSNTYTSYQPFSGDYENYLRSFIWSIWLNQYPSGWADGTIDMLPVRAIKFRYKSASVTFTDVSSQYSLGKIPTYANRGHTDKPYDIFVAPYDSTHLASASRIASALYGSGALYDLQKVPYVPSYSTAAANQWTVGGATWYWLTTDSVSATSPNLFPTYTFPTSNVQVKKDALTKKWRVVSPNHANAWDFNPTLNRGVSDWKYEVTLKPYQPYIHVYPVFGGLYGNNPNYDDRGLVCQGSFSLAVSSDQWATYQINNASYHNAFDRQVEHLSTVQETERIREIAGIVSNTVSGAVYGGTQGANYSGGSATGTALGAVAGGAVTLGASMFDYAINEKLRNEAIDYAKDQFGFNLRNIQARPHTLTQSSAFDINSATFPYVEQYYATNEEESALEHKLLRNGMTIMRIGTFMEFYDNASSDVPYIKGKLIRLPSSFKDDTHVFNEIANELYKGVYKS